MRTWVTTLTACSLSLQLSNCSSDEAQQKSLTHSHNFLIDFPCSQLPDQIRCRSGWPISNDQCSDNFQLGTCSPIRSPIKICTRTGIANSTISDFLFPAATTTTTTTASKPTTTTSEFTFKWLFIYSIWLWIGLDCPDYHMVIGYDQLTRYQVHVYVSDKGLMWRV